MATKSERPGLDVPVDQASHELALSKHNVGQVPDDRHRRLVLFIADIDGAAGRAKQKHDKRHNISASTIDLDDPMKVEVDTMLQDMAAGKQSRRVGKASVGLEGVGSWALVRERGEVSQHPPHHHPVYHGPSRLGVHARHHRKSPACVTLSQERRHVVGGGEPPWRPRYVIDGSTTTENLGVAVSNSNVNALPRCGRRGTPGCQMMEHGINDIGQSHK